MRAKIENALSQYLIDSANFIKEELGIGKEFYEYLAEQMGDIDSDILIQYFKTRNGHYRLPVERFEFFPSSLADAVDKYFEDALKSGKRKNGQLIIDEHISQAEIETQHKKWLIIKKDIIPHIQEKTDIGVKFPVWKTFFPTDFINSPYVDEGLPPSFTYRLWKNIDLYSTLNSSDLSFLFILSQADSNKRKDILQCFCNFETVPLQDVIKFAFSDECNRWNKARKICLSDSGEKSDNEKNWKGFVSKLKKLDDSKVIGLYYFMLVAYNSKFNIGAEEIDALVGFKYGLTEKGKKDFIAAYLQ